MSITIPAQSLLALAEVSKLVAIDYNPRTLTLCSMEDGLLHGVYRGSYVSSDLKVPLPEGVDDFPSLVMGTAQFADLVRLFPADSAVVLDFEPKHLVVSGSGRKARITLIQDEPATLTPFDAKVRFTAAYDELMAELGVAGNFVSSTNHLAILTGVRLMRNAGPLVLMAHDGKAGLYAGAVTCEADGVFDATVQPADIPATLSALGKGEGTVEVAFEMRSALPDAPPTASRVRITNSRGYVVLGVIAGVWPDITPITKAFERERVVLPAEAIDSVLAGIKALSADQVVYLEAKEQGLVLSTTDGEMGAYQIAVEGTPTFARIIYGAEELKLARLLGKTITLDVGLQTSTPTLVQGTNRRYWIMGRIK